ncbi:MAG TPA: hypothetical protein ENN29_08795 [Candidatus Hydrogenedentes bacterium]|nr:hypothetical protein [Candidatus Hydrogenedentota bacterium]
MTRMTRMAVGSEVCTVLINDDNVTASGSRVNFTRAVRPRPTTLYKRWMNSVSRILATFIVCVSFAHAAGGQALPLVERGRALATILVPENAEPVALYAAEEFAAHIALATGTALPIITENELADNQRACVHMHQFADAFQFYAQNGMMGSDFDSLQGMWAAQGPNLYLLARLHTRPDTPVDTLLQEYYSAFGPAADAVQRYFEYWEQYAIKNRERARDAIRTRRDGHFRRYALYALVADEISPPEVFPPAFALLDKAATDAAASGNGIHAERVLFLREGLQHALHCVEAARAMNTSGLSAEARSRALSNLARYRRSVEHLGIANMDRAAIIETDSWPEIGKLDIENQ